MAVNYTNLFTDIGCFIKAINQFRDVATGANSPVPDLPDLLDNCETVLDSTDAHDVLSGVPELFDGFKDSAVSWIGQLNNKVTQRITDRVKILEELNGIGQDTSLQNVLMQLYRDMVDSSESINASSVTLGSVTADGGNAGNGTVLLDKVLDRVSPPGPGMSANPEYKGVNSELAATSDGMSVTCVRDEDSDGTPSGEEVFLWQGQPAARSAFDWKTEGSGLSLEVPTLNSYALVDNKDFEAWDTNVPESWTIDSGTAGTHIIEETSAADVFRGSSALKFTGDGSTGTLKISQDVLQGAFVPGKRYLLACYVKGNASVAAGTLTIQFESASGGYTAASSEKIEMNAAALAAQTSYGIESFYITMPDQIPDDFELVIKVTGTLTNAVSVRVDSLAVGPVVWGNGVNIAVVAGSTAFVRNDRLTFTISNNDAGVFQTYFRKQYGVQMPSDTGGTETQADSLAT